MLSRNKLQQLPEAVGGLTNLTSLWLDNNCLAALPATLGPPPFAHGSAAAAGRARANRPSESSSSESPGPSHRDPKSARPVPSRRFIRVGRSPLCFRWGVTGGDWAGRLGALRSLALDSNALATLPACVCDLAALERLTLDSNHLRPPRPPAPPPPRPPRIAAGSRPRCRRPPVAAR